MRGISGLGLMCLVMATSGCMLDADGMRGFENCNQLRKYMNGTDVGSLLGAANFSSLSMEEVLVAELGEGGPVPGGEGDGVLDDPWDGAEVWTDTNLQDAGVDEADLVKTDGEFIYAISGGKLVISRGWPLENAQQIATVAVDGDAHGLYYYDATVVVISTLLPDETPDPASDADPWTEDAGWRDSDAVGVTVVDVLAPARPVILRATYATGAAASWAGYQIVTQQITASGRSPSDRKAGKRVSAVAVKIERSSGTDSDRQPPTRYGSDVLCQYSGTCPAI